MADNKDAAFNHIASYMSYTVNVYTINVAETQL